jgi:hypothetical protein
MPLLGTVSYAYPWKAKSEVGEVVCTSLAVKEGVGLPGIILLARSRSEALQTICPVRR